MAEVTATSKKIIGNIEKVVIGKRQEIILALVAYFSEGHILLEDVPGVAKTMLARALASSVGAAFKRVQCTPDLLPTDITGASIFNPKTTEFVFRPGPIFSQIFLADEINRATPRTQAALLEAMAERSVSVDGTTYDLTPPFLLIATQNPVDHEGTFPLPEAQLDRFLVRLDLGYPDRRGGGVDALAAPAQAPDRRPEGRGHGRRDPPVPAGGAEHPRGGQAQPVHRRADPAEPGASGCLARRQPSGLAGAVPGRRRRWRRSAGSRFITPDDIKRLVPAILGHRIILKPESRLRKVTPRRPWSRSCSTWSAVPTSGARVMA